MSEYHVEDLQDTLKVINSLLNKCRKAKTSVKEKSSQHTLLVNRINALQVAVGLIEVELFEKLKLRNSNNIENSKMKQDSNGLKSSGQGATPFAQTYFHGTKADLQIGDLIEVSYNSNYGQRKNAKYVFLAATLDAAIWGAELAFGEGQERIYLVEPTGQIENDPDLTDKKFPGNPTMSYRSTEPFRVVGEVTIWQGHPTEQVKAMNDALGKLKEQGINSLNDE